MNYKIVVDSCCELPEELLKDSKFEIVPLKLTVGDIYEKDDDNNFDQKEFLDAVSNCESCPKSSCPSPESFMNAYNTEAERVYCITLSSELSGSYNSALLARELFFENYGEKNICVIDSKSASCGETQIAYKIMEWEEEGYSFEEISAKAEEFLQGMHTYFVLDNLETLRKNGRLSAVKALVASTLSIKPIMGSTKGTIIQLAQSIGIKKALSKMVDYVVSEVKNPEQKNLMITHCNNLERALLVKKQLESKLSFKNIIVMDTAGISSMYANDGGIIVTV